MSEQPTCGQGLAQHAELPLLIGELFGSVAADLSAHIPGLVSGDENSRREKRVYEHLVARLREAGAMLHAIGTEMAGQRDMPMGDHDLQALSSGEAIDALERMTRVEAQLGMRGCTATAATSPAELEAAFHAALQADPTRVGNPLARACKEPRVHQLAQGSAVPPLAIASTGPLGCSLDGCRT